MKSIGIVGGLGPEATIEYYRLITSAFREKSGDGDYPELIVYSLNLEQCMRLAEAEDWQTMTEWVLEGVLALQRAGADFAIIAAGTPHIVFDDLRVASPIPMISIVEETLAVTQRLGLDRVGLLGTLFTMQSSVFHDAFSQRAIEVIPPDPLDQQYIHEKLRTEIALGKLVEDTRGGLLSIVERMKELRSIQGVILGCTELTSILRNADLDIPILDAARIHAARAVEYCMADA